MRTRPIHTIAALMFLLGGAADMRPAAAQSAALLTTIGPDTFAFERYERHSAYIGSATRLHLSSDGGLLELSDSRLSVRQAPTLDVAALTRHFVDAYRPRVAAQRAAAAARVEIPLSAAQLDGFVGKYGRGAMTIARDGEHLIATFSNGTRLTLLAMSQTEFFVRKPDLVIAFEVDAHGAITGMTVAQGESRQRIARDPQDVPRSQGAFPNASA